MRLGSWEKRLAQPAAARLGEEIEANLKELRYGR